MMLKLGRQQKYKVLGRVSNLLIGLSSLLDYTPGLIKKCHKMAASYSLVWGSLRFHGQLFQ